MNKKIVATTIVLMLSISMLAYLTPNVKAELVTISSDSQSTITSYGLSQFSGFQFSELNQINTATFPMNLIKESNGSQIMTKNTAVLLEHNSLNLDEIGFYGMDYSVLPPSNTYTPLFDTTTSSLAWFLGWSSDQDHKSLSWISGEPYQLYMKTTLPLGSTYGPYFKGYDPLNGLDHIAVFQDKLHPSLYFICIDDGGDIPNQQHGYGNIIVALWCNELIANITAPASTPKGQPTTITFEADFSGQGIPTGNVKWTTNSPTGHFFSTSTYVSNPIGSNEVISSVNYTDTTPGTWTIMGTYNADGYDFNYPMYDTGSIIDILPTSTIMVQCIGNTNYTIDGLNPNDLNPTPVMGGFDFDWEVGSHHIITEYPVTVSDDVRWVPGGFQSNSIGSTSSKTIDYIVPANNETLLLWWGLSYRINFTTVGQGTVQPSGLQWFNGNEVIQLSAVPSVGWRFTGWTTTLPDNFNPFTGITTPAIDNASASQTFLTATDGGTVKAIFVERNIGDFNSDGKVNFQDIVYFVHAYIQYHQTGTLDSVYDLNHDGKLNFNDITLLVHDYSAWGQSQT